MHRFIFLIRLLRLTDNSLHNGTLDIKLGHFVTKNIKYSKPKNETRGYLPNRKYALFSVLCRFKKTRHSNTTWHSAAIRSSTNRRKLIGEVGKVGLPCTRYQVIWQFSVISPINSGYTSWFDFAKMRMNQRNTFLEHVKN